MPEVRVTAAEMADKWRRRLAQSIPDIRSGIEKVRESPTEKAADAQDKMIAKLTEAVRSGKWARGLRRVSLPEWKQKTIDLGLARIAAGADAALSKVEAFAADLIAYENTVLAEIDRMPSVTLEDGINRMVTFARRMAEFSRA